MDSQSHWQHPINILQELTCKLAQWAAESKGVQKNVFAEDGTMSESIISSCKKKGHDEKDARQFKSLIIDTVSLIPSVLLK